MTKFNDVKLAIAPINWTNDDDPNLGGEVSFEQCINEIQQAGFVGTELGNKYPRDPQTLLSELGKRNLQVSSAWFSTFFAEEGRYVETLEKFMEFLSFMKAINADVINLCDCSFAIQQTNHAVYGDKKPVFTEKQWALVIKGLHEIGRIAADYKIKVSYHYHMGTGIQNENEIDFLMQHTSPELLGLLLDTGHAYAANINPLHLLEKYGSRINNVHLKDVRDQVKQKAIQQQHTFMDGVRGGMFTVPGDGSIDFAPILTQLSNLNYRGWMVVEAEQDPKQANPLEYAVKARGYIKNLTGL